MALSIGELAAHAGVAPSTIRYYERESILPKAERRNGRRVYFKEDIARLKRLCAARALGFGIKDIKVVIAPLSAPSPAQRAAMNAGLEQRQAAIKAEIQQLKRQATRLNALRACACDDYAKCETLDSGEI